MTDANTTTTTTIEIGDVSVTRVIEWTGPIAPMAALFPDASEQTWRSRREWLQPDFIDSDEVYLANMQTWVLRSEGRVILIDTGIGNGKERAYMPPWSHLHTDFLERLRLAGVEPADVDIVVNTHIHADHVGWNTVLVDREWLPTFPNAQYLIPRADFDFWNPFNRTTKVGTLGDVPPGLANQGVFEDSVLPIKHHGQAVLWEGKHQIDSMLALEPFPGHTPGSSVLSLTSRDGSALFVGDLLHSPLQVDVPEIEACLSEDSREAIRQRRRMLERAADTNSLVLPAHLPGHGALEVRRQGSSFSIVDWAPFSAAP